MPRDAGADGEASISSLTSPASDASRLSRLSRYRGLIVALVVLAGLGLTWLGWLFVARTETKRIEADFLKRAAVQMRLARERLQLHEELVRGLRAYLENSSDVQRGEFAAYVKVLLERLPAGRAFQWAPRIPHERRAALEAEMRAIGHANFRLWERDVAGQLGTPAIPARERPEYWPILWAEPHSGNEPSLGFDLHESIVTRPMLDAARARKELMLSPQVRLIRTQETDRGAGVIFIEPVFRPGDPNAAPEDGFLGFIQAIFSVDRLLAQVHTESPDDALDFAYYDDSAQFEHLRLLYARIDGREYSGSGDAAPRPIDAPPSLHDRADATGEKFRIGGRDWRIVITPNAAWLARQRSPLPWLVSAGELGLTLFAALFVSALLSRTAQTEQMVARRTGELVESRRQLAGLLADMPGAAYRCAPEPPYPVLFVSDGVEDLTGVPARDFVVGERKWVELIHAEDVPECERRIAAAIESREPFELEYRLLHRDGTTRYVWERGHAVYGDDGRPRFIEGLVVDATDRKAAETRAREFDRQLLETQKLESLGVLAGGIAHDFNNILTAVLGNAALAKLQLPANAPVKPHLDQIETAARRAADLCAQMLAYAGRGTLAPSRVDLSALVRDTAALLEVSIGKGTRLHLHLPVQLPAVQADATQLRQIVMNLVINAAEAIGDRAGAITVSTFTQTVTPADLHRAVQHPELPGGVYVGLEVRDNGSGIPPETIARMFEPFFTTKFSGRGLGLSAVLGIVRSHRGALFVESEVGAGSRLRLLLPAAHGEVPTGLALGAAGQPASDALPQLQGTILIVDDESAVREMGSMALRHAGLEVMEAADGFQALTLCRDHPEMIDLVLLDLTMPNLSGEETLRRLRMQGAKQKVILMSGYSANEATRRCQQLGAVAFVQKPFEIAALLKLIGTHLR
jgi:two-component system cell cycle sensor histidine kinase/response regulator CckA